MESRVAALEEQYALLQVGVETQIEQKCAQIQQSVETTIVTELAQVKDELGQTIEQKIIQGLEAWWRKGGTVEGSGGSGSITRTITDKGKQPMVEEEEHTRKQQALGHEKYLYSTWG